MQSLRTIISGLQAKSKERQWMKNQTQGELDDMRLIEGITGEKSIYKKRGEQVRKGEGCVKSPCGQHNF